MERFRVFQDATASQEARYLWTPNSGPPGVVDEIWVLPKWSRKRSMYDVVTPGYRKLQNQGVIINNPRQLEDVLYSNIPHIIEADWWYGGVPGHMIMPIQDTLAIPNRDATLPDKYKFEQLFKPYADLEALASNRAWANVQLSEAALLASIGELPETLSWLKSLFSRLVKLTKMFRSKTAMYRTFPTLVTTFIGIPPRRLKRYLDSLPKKTSDHLKLFSDAWLEWRYAIRPLIFEIKQAVEALSKLVTKASRQTARGKEVRLVDTSKQLTMVTSSAGGITTTKVKQTVKATYQCRAGVLFEIEDDLDTLMAVWGLDQPLEAIYELLPFSFMLDWVFSVGDTIGAWSSQPSLNPLASWCTYKLIHKEKRETLNVDMVGANGYTFAVRNVTPGKAELTFERTWRKPVAQKFVLPRLDLKLDLAKIIDLSTIGRNILTGGKTSIKKGA